ncbi:AraC family transcriptional regulator [Cronobacter sp. JZ38]|uniref:helix-turn-helix domain-containing protein n=1 Tax=Cronobacter sp. JZ38 TaxID=1906275 RepID=UPI0012A05D1E|nr:AraC family transcriptional regulator [Cronobacter sp. JZ38]
MMAGEHGARTSAFQLEDFLNGDVIASNDALRDSGASLVQLIRRERDNPGVTVPAVAEPLLVWVVDGEAQVSEREGEGEWQTRLARAGTFYLTATATPYDMRWTLPDGKPFTVMHIYLEQALLDDAFRLCHGIDYAQGEIDDVAAESDPHLDKLLSWCQQEIAHPQKGSGAVLAGALKSLAVWLVRRYGRPRHPNDAARQHALPAWKLQNVKQHLRAHLAAPFHLPTLAQMCAMSNWHFSRQFKQATGASPSAWFIQQRIQVACRLLRETALPVIDIACEVGYVSPSHFSQVFRKITGMSPAAYRRR